MRRVGGAAAATSVGSSSSDGRQSGGGVSVEVDIREGKPLDLAQISPDIQHENLDLNLLAIICDSNKKTQQQNSAMLSGALSRGATFGNMSSLECNPIARKNNQDPDEGIDYGLMQILGLRPPKHSQSNGQHSDSATTSRESESPVERMPKTLEEALNGHLSAADRTPSISTSPTTSANQGTKRRRLSNPQHVQTNNYESLHSYPSMDLSPEAGDSKVITTLKLRALQAQIERDQAITEYYRAKTEALLVDKSLD